MLFALICTDKPNSLDLRLSTRPVHVEYLNSLGSKLKAAGPFTDDAGQPNGSLVIIEAADPCEAKAMAEADPYAKAGPLRLRRDPAWKWTLKNPKRRDGELLALQVRARGLVLGTAEGQGPGGRGVDGFRNYQARNFMRAMKLGDRGFFYHSNDGRQIVGIVEVAKLAHKDSTSAEDAWNASTSAPWPTCRAPFA